ncbi:MAG TPA: biotin--[acetyl-CoA-carboxylase] ligase [Blastocatellia bacterium]|nr:biotin--[acetyl-CoA-carboxylase] ligase [Blastocatellia bacterium]
MPEKSQADSPETIRNPQSAIRNQIIHRPPFIIHHFATLGSTNDQLKQMTDAPELTCVVADEQTAGRGRRDRAWHSTPGDGLYLSVLLRPALPSEKIPLLSLMCAVVVAEAVGGFHPAGIDIKWPNDVLVNERKLGGILIEGASVGADAPRLIAGIGVNLNHRSFPSELSKTATSLAIECGHQLNLPEFRDQLLVTFAEWYERLRHGGRLIIGRWQQLSSYAIGKPVVVTLDDEQFTGVTDGLTETGALRLRTASGETRTIIAGEVSRLRSGVD